MRRLHLNSEVQLDADPAMPVLWALRTNRAPGAAA